MLGPLEVLRDGAPVPLGGPRQRAVLARLLVDAGRVVPAAALIEDVWSGAPPATATKTLQRYVWQLRKSLCARDVLQTRGRGYRLAPGDDGVDAGRFERLLAVARAARSGGDLAGAAGSWRAALGLWRGEVLADLADDPFTAPERSRLGELRLAAFESCLDCEVALGGAAEVAAEVAELVEAHPLRQRLWATLMTALALSGRQIDALRAFERYRRMLADELGLEPAAELRDLERDILAGGRALTGAGAVGAPAAPAAFSVTQGIPTPATSFVGRGDELAAIERALAGSRLVTLTGPAGVGKTRLAVEVASRARHLEHAPQDVWFVELAARQEGHAVAQAVAAALGIDEEPGVALEDTIVAALAHRPVALIVLDNCEHLLEMSAAFAHAVLARCPSVRVLATSRHLLGLDAETVWPVPPLGDEAVELFADRARTAAPAGGFALTPDIRPVVAELCRRLDGLPLAVELAASQVRVLEPGQIVDRLDDRLRLLTRPHGAVPRHRTLGATIAWSHELLGPAARTTLARLGAFPGSFTLEAAEAVCAGGDVARRDVLGHVTALVDHSLLVREPGPASVARYRLLDTIRIFATEQLAASGDLAARRTAHAAFHLELAQRADPHFYGPDERLWRERLLDEDHNLDAALRWTRDHDPDLSARLAVALWFYWDATWRERAAIGHLAPLLDPGVALAADRRGWALVVAAALGSHHGDARTPMAWAEQAVEVLGQLGDGLGLAWAHHVHGEVLTNHGSLDGAERSLRTALDGFRRHADPRGIGLTLGLLGVVAIRRSDHAAAERWHLEELAVWRHLRTRLGQGTALRRLATTRLRLGNLPAAAEACGQARAAFTSLDDATSVAHVLSTEGDIARARGDDAAATALYEQAMDGFRSVGDRRCTASTYKNLAAVAARCRDHDTAQELFREAIALRHDLGDVAGLAECLEGLAGCSIDLGDAGEAATLLAVASAIRHSTGAARAPADQRTVARAEHAARTALGPRTYDTTRSAVARLSPADMVAQLIGPR